MEIWGNLFDLTNLGFGLDLWIGPPHKLHVIVNLIIGKEKSSRTNLVQNREPQHTPLILFNCHSRVQETPPSLWSNFFEVAESDVSSKVCGVL